MKRLLWIILLGVGASWVVRQVVFEGIEVATGSMEPTLPVGNRYLVNKMVYHFEDPKRGDIIVFWSPIDQTHGMIKRVIAVPGDRIEMRDKKVILNGEVLTEPYTVYKRPGERLEGDTMAEMHVPTDSYFVLGDNRDESDDATNWRDKKTDERKIFLAKENIQGRLIQIP